MNRTLAFIFFILLFISCNKNTSDTCQDTTVPTDTETTLATPCEEPADPSPDPIPAPVPEPVIGSTPQQAQSWSADVYFVNFSQAQEGKVNTAISLMRKVIASDEFRTRVLNHTYKGKKTFVDNGGLSNAQIYQKILDGAEKMGDTSKNNQLNVELELYYAATTTIGYTYPSSLRIWMNTKYFNNYTPVKIADNLMHEWLHKLGFGHTTTYSASRNYSVPYAIGYMVEELAAKLK
jgi:hypothetical protein